MAGIIEEMSDDEVKMQTEQRKEKKEKKDKKEKKSKKRARESSDSETETKSIKESIEAIVAEETSKESKKKAKREKSADVKSESSTKPVTAESDKDANGNPPLTDYPVPAPVLKTLAAKGITHAFPIQAATFAPVHAGQDVLGRARTGTGKTLAFALPIVLRLQSNDLSSNGGARLKQGRTPRVLVLTPTRELAKQVCETFEMCAPQLVCTTVYGGAPYPPMEAALRRGVDVIVGTCGRCMDLLDRGALKLDNIEVLILDEADEMLDMGFADDIEKILSTVPREGREVQTLLFSATLPAWVQQVSKKYLRKDAKQIDLVGDVAHKASADVAHYAVACHWSERNSILKQIITMYGGEKARTIVFTETKKEANEITTDSSIAGQCGVLHGDIAQSQRETTLNGFRDGKFSVLVATDVAARGIDIPGVELVIQIEPPSSVETYIHRSGRTGRANTKGTALTFYTPKQLYFLNQIEKVAKVKFTRTGVPGRDDIYSSSAQGAVKSITSVHKDVIPHFLDAARQLLASDAFKAASKPSLSSSDSDSDSDSESEKEVDPAYVLAAAIACVSGHKDPIAQRSLLTSTAGWTTVHFTCPFEVRSLSFVWSAINRYLFTGENESNDKIKGMRLTSDKCGAVFDVPSSEEEAVKKANATMEANERERQRMVICKTLPPLPQAEQLQRPESRWQRGGGGRSGGYGGGRGGSRGGRGGSRGGRR